MTQRLIYWFPNGSYSSKSIQVFLKMSYSEILLLLHVSQNNNVLIVDRHERRLGEDISNIFYVIKYVILWDGLTTQIMYLRKVQISEARERGVTDILYL